MPSWVIGSDAATAITDWHDRHCDRWLDETSATSGGTIFQYPLMQTGVGNNTASLYLDANGGLHGSRPVETPEEAIAREARLFERERQARERAAVRTNAEQRARRLLEEFLNEEQAMMVREFNCFRVLGSDGMWYEIDTTVRHQNVYELDRQGNRIRNLCAYQTGGTPLADNLLAQKLMLESDANRFKRIANVIWDRTSRFKRIANVIWDRTRQRG